MGLTYVDTEIEITDFELSALDGTVSRFSDYSGSVVMLNFWASWCPPCRAEMPSMSRLSAELSGSDFAMIAVNVGEPVSLVESFVTEFDIDFPVFVDPTASIAGDFGISALPTTILFDRSGKVVAAVSGSLEWDDEIIVTTMKDWTR